MMTFARDIIKKILVFTSVSRVFGIFPIYVIYSGGDRKGWSV